MRIPAPFERVHVRFGSLLLAMCWLALLAGCVAVQRIVWSPDGSQAAVLSDEGLCLCDADGNISGVLVSNVQAVAWFQDSRRLVFVQVEGYTNWSSFAAHLSPELRQDLRQGAAMLLAKLQAGDPKKVLEAEGQNAKHFDALVLCLRDEQGEAASKLLNGSSRMKDLKASLSFIHTAQAQNRTLRLEAALALELGVIEDIRVSPKSDALAYSSSSCLYVLPLQGGQPAQLVSARAAAHPDWSADGTSLYYVAAANTNLSSDDVVLGALTRRRVMGEGGQVGVQEAKDELVGLMFNGESRVRCLRDGRILFASEEWRLPATTKDLPQRQQLFVLDPERHATLTALVPRAVQEQLPDNLSYFELSPDEKRIAVGGDKCMVTVFTLSSGDVDVVQPRTDTDSKGVPSWRTSTELCYVAVEGSKTNEHCEVALWQKGSTNVISRNWSASIRKGLLD